MQIAPNSVVVLSYTLSNAKGERKMIEEVSNEHPLAFIFGVQPFLPKFEEGIAGKKAGDTFEIEIPAAEAYGHRSDEQIAELPVANFMVNGELQEDLLVVGKTLNMRGQDGHIMQAVVQEVGKEIVKMDFNHPLVDVDLHFTGEIIEVREASAEELDHRHVHGKHGHQH